MPAFPSLAGKAVIIADDGLSSGNKALAAAHFKTTARTSVLPHLFTGAFPTAPAAFLNLKYKNISIIIIIPLKI
jgi:predicted phosphoribosyltransferase